MALRTRSSRTVYENQWMRVREDETVLPDGSPGTYGVVEKPDFALVIPTDADGSLWLVEQHRYPVGLRLWEFPQGTAERGDEVPPPEVARSELAEETGLRAGALRHLGHLFSAYGYSNQGFHVWLATDLAHGEPAREPAEQDMRVGRVSRERWLQMIGEGLVRDAASIAAYGLLLMYESADRSA
jgi:8-oxo-dGTP pyrophosphatase MutT (NUDIX family)